MSLRKVPSYFIPVLVQDIDTVAKEVSAAHFVDGEESNVYHRFYRLYGKVVKVTSHDGSHQYHYVEGSDREMFDAHYPEV